MRSLYARLDQRYGVQRTPAAERVRQMRPHIDAFHDRLGTQLALSAAPLAARKKVAVVGAGFAGLMAAAAMAGTFEVTVFEARDRVGGRVHTLIDRERRQAVEAGAELIGYNHVLWLSLAKQFDLGLTVLTYDDAFADLALDMPLWLNGHSLRPQDAEGVYERMEPLIRRICKEAAKIKNPYEPWNAGNASDLDAMSVADWLREQKPRPSPLAKRAFTVEFENTNAIGIEKQSYLANLAAIRGGALHGGKPDDYFTRSERVKCEQGNDMLSKKLAEEVGQDKVRLNSPVERIEILADRARIHLTGEQAPFEADYAVLAVPPSLWLSGDNKLIMIDPPPPAGFKLSMGPAIKYLSPMKTRFWLPEDLSPNAVSDRFGMTWEGTDNQMQIDENPVWLNLFAGGKAAEDAMKLSEDELHKSYALEIENLYKGYTKNLASKPSFVAWPKEPWTAGGYSCPAPGELTRMGSFLRDTFHDRLYFAGEHCCPAFFGYMEGALESGLHAARAICRREGLHDAFEDILPKSR